MASGVTVNDRCSEKFQQVKMLSKGSAKRKFSVLKMSDDVKEIVPDEESDALCCCNLQELLSQLPQDDGRYVIYDYGFTSKAGASTSKLILLLWCPANISIKKKMLYASSKSAVKVMITEEVPEFQCDCCDDISDQDILAKVNK